MSSRHPSDCLTADEGLAVRNIVRAHGIERAQKMLGNIHWKTLSKAAAEMPIARLTATVIRRSLDDL